MATDAEWALGYARQADADFMAWLAVQNAAQIAERHKLLLLQIGL